ncbi:MAG: proprotein convertase P-domain-containing protein [Planctomycetota bacterium]
MIANSKNLIRVVVIFVSMLQTICLGQITASLPYCSLSTLESGTTNQVVLAFTATNNTNGTIENVGGDIVLSKNTSIDGADEILWSDTFLKDTLGPFETFRYGWPAYGGTWPLKIPLVPAGPYYIIFRVYPGGDTSYTPVDIIPTPTQVVLQASEPRPADGAQHSGTWVNLSWISGDTAVSHDIFFGTSYNSVNNGTEGTFRGNQVGTSFVAGLPGYDYPDGLIPGTTYYWRIDEVNDAHPDSPWKGSVWSFTAEEYVSVPIITEEQTLEYDNTVYPYFTEWVYDIQADLTAGGRATDLVLTFKGDPENSAEPMYVTLEDSTGATATVKYPHAAPTQIAHSVVWRISLTDFPVDLKNTKRLIITTGIEGELGGKGATSLTDGKSDSGVLGAMLDVWVWHETFPHPAIPDANVYILELSVLPPDKPQDIELITNGAGNCFTLEPFLGHTYSITVEIKDYETYYDEITINTDPCRADILLKPKPQNVREYPLDGLVSGPLLDNEWTWFELDIPDAGTIVDMDVKLRLAHDKGSQLEVALVRPAFISTFVVLSVDDSSWTDGEYTIFDDDVLDVDESLRHRKPEPGHQLSVFDGESVEGTWQLVVKDRQAIRTGELHSWSLIVTLQE